MIKLLGFTAFLMASGLADQNVDKRCKIWYDTMLNCLDATIADLPRIMNPEIAWLAFRRSSIPLLRKEYFEYYPALTDIYLRESYLDSIEADAFFPLKNLSWVDVSANRLTYINPNLFYNSPNMYYFDLSCNPGLILPRNEPFLYAPDLEWLMLQSAGLTCLYPETFSSLQGLKFLSLSDNRLSVFPVEVFHPLQNLIYLDLSRNHFKSLTFDMNAFPFGALYLGENPLEYGNSLLPGMRWSMRNRIFGDAWCGRPYNPLCPGFGGYGGYGCFGGFGGYGGYGSCGGFGGFGGCGGFGGFGGYGSCGGFGGFGGCGGFGGFGGYGSCGGYGGYGGYGCYGGFGGYGGYGGYGCYNAPICEPAFPRCL